MSRVFEQSCTNFVLADRPVCLQSEELLKHKRFLLFSQLEMRLLQICTWITTRPSSCYFISQSLTNRRKKAVHCWSNRFRCSVLNSIRNNELDTFWSRVAITNFIDRIPNFFLFGILKQVTVIPRLGRFNSEMVVSSTYFQRSVAGTSSSLIIMMNSHGPNFLCLGEPSPVQHPTLRRSHGQVYLAVCAQWGNRWSKRWQGQRCPISRTSRPKYSGQWGRKLS